MTLRVLRRLANTRAARSTARRLGGPVLLEQAVMFARLGYWPNLRAPRTFNEHMARVKLFERDPRLPVLADKLAVRDHVARLIGPEYLPRHYGVWADARALSLDALPSQFVLKPNNACMQVRLVRDKQGVAEADLRALAARWLAARYGRLTQEWWYGHIPPRVFAEELLSDPAYPTTPPEVKFFMFGGEIGMIAHAADRFANFRTVYVDEHWRRLPLSISSPLGPDVPPPPHLGEMKAIARCLAGGHRFVRVDLYALPNRRIVFGELTFCCGAGRMPFAPDAAADLRVGRLWRDMPAPSRPMPALGQTADAR